MACGQRWDAIAGGRGDFQRRHFGARIGLEGQGAFEVLQRPLRALAVGLVDHQHVGDLEQSRFHRLDVVAEAGRRYDHAHVGDLGDVDIGLAGADRLEQDDVLAGGVERVDHPHRRRTQAAQVAAARQASA